MIARRRWFSHRGPSNPLGLCMSTKRKPRFSVPLAVRPRVAASKWAIGNGRAVVDYPSVPFTSGTTPQTASNWSLSWGRFFLGPRQRAALIRDRRLPRRQGQTISFDEHAVVFGLRPRKKAHKHKGRAKQQAYQHYPTVRVIVVKIHDATNPTEPRDSSP